MIIKTRSTFILLTGIAFFLSCSQGQKPSSDNNQKWRSAGAQIFYDNCVECHGSDGKRQLKGAKDLSISTLSMKERIRIISSAQIIGNKLHKPRWEKILSENEINEVAQYLDLLRK